MGIYSALNIGNTALLASQKALEVVGNNIANAATPSYSRQDTLLIPGASLGTDLKIGTGVEIDSIMRRFDAAVESRLRCAIGDATSQQIQQQVLDRVESLYNETTDADLSTALASFFNGFDDLANDPTNDGVRTIVIERARTLVNQITRLRNGMDGLRGELNDTVQTTVDEINRLAGEIADLNIQVIVAERGQVGSAPGQRDERDARLRELSELINIRVVEQNSGGANVIIGNQILVDGRFARELTYETVSDRGLGVSEIRFVDNDELVSPTSGALQGYLTGRDDWVGQQIDSLDQMAQSLILEVNALHAEGTGKEMPQTLRSDQFVLDATAALGSTDAGLHNTPVNGSFLLHVTNSISGLTETLTIDVDLDGVGPDDSLQDVATRINTLAALEVPPLPVAASVDSTGHLIVAGTSAEMRISFSDDSSRLLAVLGMNCLFTGYDSLTIGLSDDLVDNPSLLAAGLSGTTGDNANALRLAALADEPIGAINGRTLLDYHNQAVTRMAVSTAAAHSACTAAEGFMATMNDEREAISGVNLDEEAVNLIRYQKMYSAAARFMSVMAGLMDTMLEI